MYWNHTKGLYTGFKKFSFNLIHKYTSIWRTKLGINDSSIQMLFNFTIKFKVVVFQNKFYHFNKVLSTNFFVYSIIKHSP